MTPLPLHISSVQNGPEFFLTPAPVTAGGPTLLCHNLRRRGNLLQHSPLPTPTATLSGTPLIADRRFEGYYFLRQEDDGTIMLDGFLHMERLTFESIGLQLGRPLKKVVRAQTAGQYVVLLFNDGTLGYLHFDNPSRSYTYLGDMPQLPSPQALMVEETELNEPVEQVLFRQPVDDIRQGLDTAAREQIGKSMRQTWERLRRRGRESDLWLQPVEVRLAYRLADGQLLHVSDPCRVQCGWQCGGRVAMAPLNNSSGETEGVSGGIMSATGYRLRLDPDSISLGVWEKVIASVEVWVTEEADPADTSALPIVSVSTSSSAVAVVAQLIMLPQASLDASLAATPCAILRRLLPEESIGTLAPRPDLLYNLDAEVIASQELRHSRVNCILGHDGFLHIASSYGLTTSARSNPFVKASRTPGDYSGIRLMVPQIWGGGAYTRQIIYVADEHGVSALAHDSSGRHTNFRTICSNAPRNESYVAATDSCVYMLLEDGTLSRFTGTRAEKLLTRIDGCSGICFSKAFHELILMPASPQGHCVVIGAGGLADVSTRDPLNASPVPGAPSLVYVEEANGLVHLLSLDSMADGSPGGECSWMAQVEMPRSESMWRTLTCGIGGSDIDVTLQIGQADPTPGGEGTPQTLTRLRMRGTPHGLLRFPFRPGATQNEPLATRGHWRLHLTGRLTTIYQLTIE